MTMGMFFIDMAFLRNRDIIDGRIKFQRKKTSKMYDIKVTEQIKVILKYYLCKRRPNDFILPILKRDSLEFQYRDAQWRLKNYNLPQL